MGSKKTISVHEHFIRGNTTFDHNHFHSYHDKTKNVYHNQGSHTSYSIKDIHKG